MKMTSKGFRSHVKGEFARGHIERAERDVLARQLAKYEDHVHTPYALATSMIEKGYKVKGKKAIAREFAEQKRMKRRKL